MRGVGCGAALGRACGRLDRTARPHLGGRDRRASTSTAASSGADAVRRPGQRGEAVGADGVEPDLGARHRRQRGDARLGRSHRLAASPAPGRRQRCGLGAGRTRRVRGWRFGSGAAVASDSVVTKGACPASARRSLGRDRVHEREVRAGRRAAAVVDALQPEVEALGHVRVRRPGRRGGWQRHDVGRRRVAEQELGIELDPGRLRDGARHGRRRPLAHRCRSGGRRLRRVLGRGRLDGGRRHRDVGRRRRRHRSRRRRDGDGSVGERGDEGRRHRRHRRHRGHRRLGPGACSSSVATAHAGATEARPAGPAGGGPGPGAA
ncbi:MAG: hypothetical protein R3F59_08530 [Myxococcota bacterium]